jgi:energy-converting hydrogenase Eha subunit A
MSEENDRSFLDKMSPNMESVQVDLRRALIGGSVSAIVILVGGWLAGFASGSEAFDLFKTALPSTRSFAGTLSLALGNILALMLTLLSLSASMDIDIKWVHYQRVRQISWGVTVTLIITVLVYLLLNIPIVESDKNLKNWYTAIYYSTLVFSALLGGAFITIILLLYNTVRDMIGMLDPESEHSMRHTEEEE